MSSNPILGWVGCESSPDVFDVDGLREPDAVPTAPLVKAELHLARRVASGEESPHHDDATYEQYQQTFLKQQLRTCTPVVAYSIQ